MRFMTRETFKEPPTEEVKSILPAEIARVKELKQQGLIEAFYVAADQSGAWVIAGQGWWGVNGCHGSTFRLGGEGRPLLQRTLPGAQSHPLRTPWQIATSHSRRPALPAGPSHWRASRWIRATPHDVLIVGGAIAPRIIRPGYPQGRSDAGAGV